VEFALVPGPAVFHGLNISFCLLLFVVFPCVVAMVLFITISIVADESSISLLCCLWFWVSVDIFVFVRLACSVD